MRENLLDCAGKEFTAMIGEKNVKGHIQVEGNHAFLCQNTQSGSQPLDLLGYKYGWCVLSGRPKDLDANRVSKLVITDKSSSGKLTKIQGEWVILCDGTQHFIEVLTEYCEAFHPECKYDFDYEDEYYGFNGESMDYGMDPGVYPYEMGVTEYSLEKFKQIINYNLKTKSNEKSSVKVQRETPDVTEGERFTGISVSGRTGKIAVSIGHLSYKTVSNECF